MTNELGKIIKQLRVNNGLSQGQMADLLNVTSVAICNWENEKNVPSMENIKKINSYFGISIEAPLKDKKEKEVHTLEKDGIKRRRIDINSIATVINTARHIYNRDHSIKMRQEDLAKRVGLNAWSFSKRMIGETTWKISELKKVAKVLNLKSHFLIFGSSYDKNTPKINQSKITKNLDSNGNAIYSVEEINYEKNPSETKKTNEKLITVAEENEFQMFMKFKKFMEAQNEVN